ncbi:unnamed protein product [Thelazia callipaeda]|uniref:Saposin B-type domain-containing protein n=1 Tax=Thelazia callipaeda TaxID=103827 RepID=A0A0N5D5Z4_THECL|nr:unnamed protein product [Thelazia callipaeda]
MIAIEAIVRGIETLRSKWPGEVLKGFLTNLEQCQEEDSHCRSLYSARTQRVMEEFVPDDEVHHTFPSEAEFRR